MQGEAGIFATTMQIKVTGKNLDVGGALREHIESRLLHLQQRFFEGSVHAHVTVEKQRAGFHSDCALHLATGLVLQAEGNAADAHPSFDLAASHLEKQLKPCTDFADAIRHAEELTLADVPGDDRKCQGNAARCACSVLRYTAA